MGSFHRHNIIRPIRDVLNFFVYRKYVKKFDLETADGRKWLYELKRNMDIMGFNDGIETFETYYEGDQRIGRSIVKSALRRQKTELSIYESNVESDKRFNEAEERRNAIIAKEKAEKLKIQNRFQPYNPEWKPTEQKLRSRTPRVIKERYVGLVVKEYEILEHGQVAIMITLRGSMYQILSGQRLLEVMGKASKIEDDLAYRYKLRVNTVPPVKY